jgi:DNA-binding response OmpR family regulator
MLVEDDPDHRRIYGTLLWYNGFNVFVAPDVTRTRRVLSFLRPDLILLDLALPDGDGLQICRTVRELDPEHPVPIVALSSFPTAQMEVRAVAAGCARYLEKQLSSPLAVLRAVEEILGRAPPSGEGATSWMLDYPSKDPPLDSP